ncbi:MAG: purine-binding chemotaxis protein CheW [Desulfuromonadales bacterium]|nr:purine-binding chemotaxis protein CheW [Desulfuromonadales bacterium]
MDLVKIRKKAKSAREKPTKKPEVKVDPELLDTVTPVDTRKGTSSSSIVQTSPDASGSAALPPPVSEPKSKEIDPLEALFAFRVDGTLATEELYLKALMGDDDAVDGELRQWLTFSLGTEEYALELGVVNEIIKSREVTDIPRVPDFIRGIISLRGIIVPVIDLRRRLKIGVIEPGLSTRIVVCQQSGKLAGLLVDSINQVVNISSHSIEPPPTVLSGLDRDFVEGVGRIDGRMLILLHLANVINAELT